MSDYRPGEIVDVTIKGVRIAATEDAIPPMDPRGLLVIADEHGDLYPLPPQAAITRVAPAHWPPQEGDVWRRDADGLNWFGVLIDNDDTTDSPYVLLTCSRSSKDRYGRPCDEALYTFGPFTLTHRVSVTAEPKAVLPEHWPPQHDDQWQDGDGYIWTARAGKLHVHPSSLGEPQDEVLRKFAPLTLVRRERAGAK